MKELISNIPLVKIIYYSRLSQCSVHYSKTMTHTCMSLVTYPWTVTHKCIQYQYEVLFGPDCTLDFLKSYETEPIKIQMHNFFKAKEDFLKSCTINSIKIDQNSVTKIPGSTSDCWIQEYARHWSINTQELVKAAYSILSMLTKLK